MGKGEEILAFLYQVRGWSFMTCDRGGGGGGGGGGGHLAGASFSKS